MKQLRSRGSYSRLTLREHSSESKISCRRASCFSQSLQSPGSSWDHGRDRRASGTLESGAAKCLAPPLCQMFLSLFHNSHRGYLSALPLALAHINYGQLMEANMLGASRLTKSTLLRILAAQRDRAHFPPAGTTVVRSKCGIGSWDEVAEKRRDSVSWRKKSDDAITCVTRALKTAKKISR